MACRLHLRLIPRFPVPLYLQALTDHLQELGVAPIAVRFEAIHSDVIEAGGHLVIVTQHPLGTQRGRLQSFLQGIEALAHMQEAQG